jgi:hypothetical protein
VSGGVDVVEPAMEVFGPVDGPGTSSDVLDEPNLWEDVRGKGRLLDEAVPVLLV